MAALELVFMRHAEAHCQIAQRVGGPRGCTGLTRRGWAQAEDAARWLAAEHNTAPFAAVYSSPLLRVRQTASVVERVLGLGVVVRDDLRDPDYGEADGLLWRDVMARVHATPEEGLEVPIAPGAEPWADYLKRVGAELDRIAAQHQGERVLVIAHGETISAAGYRFFEVPPAVRLQAGFTTDATGITRWSRRPLALAAQQRLVWTLLEHNRTIHLRQGVREAVPVGGRTG